MTIPKLFISHELQCDYNNRGTGPFVFLKNSCACGGLARFVYENFYLLFTSISEHLLRYIVYSFDRFCSVNTAKVRKVGISEIWIRRRLRCFGDSAELVSVRLKDTNPTPSTHSSDTHQTPPRHSQDSHQFLNM